MLVYRAPLIKRLCRAQIEKAAGNGGGKKSDQAAKRVAEERKRLVTERKALLAEVSQYKERISSMQAKHLEQLDRANAKTGGSTSESEARCSNPASRS